MKTPFLLLIAGFISIAPVMAGGSKEPTPTPNPPPAAPVQSVPRSAPAPSSEPVASPPPAPITLRPAPAPAQPVNPFYTGSGGKGISLAILAPKGTGLVENQNYLPALVQGELVSNFSGYSAISVLDRESLDEQYAELLSGYYDDNAETGNDLGHLTPTEYLMSGSITKTATGYALQIRITKTADKMTAASYSGTCTFAELDNLTGIRRASLDLLEKMGVTPTERTRAELSAAATQQSVNAQTALAQGITAQRNGTEVAALSYYYQAAAFDPSLLEAASRASVVSTNITSGNIGTDARNDIQWRKDWIARLTETEQYFDNFFTTSSSPFGLFYSTDLEKGKIDYQKETIPISFTVVLNAPSIWFESVQKALQAVLDGLNATGRKNEWGLQQWPQKGVTSSNPFNQGSKRFAVVFELVNARQRVIGSQTVILTGYWRFSFDSSNSVVIYFNAGGEGIEPKKNNNYYDGFYHTTFGAVKTDDITDTLTINIANINGAAPQTAIRNGIVRQIMAISGNWRHLSYSDGVITGFAKSSPSIQAITIPETIGGKRVTSIGDSAFSNNQLTSVTIPNGVTSIGDSAFSNNQLTNVTIPDSVTSIGDRAFSNNQLTSVTIPSGVTYIGEFGFSDNQMTSVTISDSVTYIGKFAFYKNKLARVTIPSGVTSIEDAAFSSNEWLTSITIGANVRLSVSSFLGGFQVAYDRNGKKAGTYLYNGSNYDWSFKP
jgi:hypothetical protein